jgi:hypothetical protein
MDRTVAVAYYPEGAGHATRMLAVARALEARGVGVSLAGGGPGAEYVEVNGYEQFSPTAVDFVADYQGRASAAGNGNADGADAAGVAAATGTTDVGTGPDIGTEGNERTPAADGWTARVGGEPGRFGGRRVGVAEDGSLARVLTRSLPDSARRVRDYVGWLRRTDPDAIVTDDMFAAMAASLVTVPLYVLTHNASSYYDAVIEQSFTWLLNRYQLSSANAFLYPAVWPPDPDDPPGVTYVPPVALEPAEWNSPTAPEDVDVLLVPSTYSTGFADLADALRADGRSVTLVGDREWTPVPAMVPYIRAADVVVCSGYSTVMEAAVGATPCVIWPFTDEQHGFTRVIERTGLPGFQVEHSIPHVRRAVRHPPEAPRYENGAARVAAFVDGRLA